MAREEISLPGGCYAYAINAHAPAATPTDWFTIKGSATKVVKLWMLRIQTRATAGSQYRISLIRYGALFTGGTPAVVTGVPLDDEAAATAVVNTWNGGLPTVGATVVGKIFDESLPQAVLGTPAAGLFPYVYDFLRKPVVLRGVAQYLALNSAGVALPGGFVADVTAFITEE